MLPGPPEALVTQDLERGLPCGLWGMCVYVCALSAPPTGPLPAPLLVLCPSRAELDRWLYHLEKQTALLGGLQHCHSAPPQVSARDPTPLPTQILAACSDLLLTGVLWRRAPLDSATPPKPAADGVRARTRRQRCLCLEGQAAAPARTGGWEVHGAVGGQEGCRVLGRAGTGSGCTAAQPPHRLTPPTQEQWDRLLVLYPTSLAIFSEELDGLCFKVGPSPLWARPREAPVWGWKGAAVQEEPVFRGLLRQSARPAVLVSLVSP